MQIRFNWTVFIYLVGLANLFKYKLQYCNFVSVADTSLANSVFCLPSNKKKFNDDRGQLTHPRKCVTIVCLLNLTLCLLSMSFFVVV